MNSNIAPETWRRVPGITGYLVSDAGRVMSTRREQVRILRPGRLRKGYLGVNLGRSYRVHRLVLEAFVGPCPEGQEARHLNGDPADNRLENLAWGTSSENKADMIAMGRHNQASKTVCPAGHKFAVHGYRDRGGKRRCRQCEAKRATARRASTRVTDRG